MRFTSIAESFVNEAAALVDYFPLRSAVMNGSVTGGAGATPAITTSRGDTLGP